MGGTREWKLKKYRIMVSHKQSLLGVRNDQMPEVTQILIGKF